MHRLAPALLLLACGLGFWAWPALPRSSDAAYQRPDAQQRRQGRHLQADPSADQALTAASQWGVLRDAQQFLLTARPGLTRQQRADLSAHIAAAGCHVAGFGGQHTLLLVGPAAAAAALEQHEHVVSAAPRVEAGKLAPEWQTVLQRLEELQAHLQQLGSSAQAAADAVAALPVADEWRAGSGELLVGATVSFPRRVRRADQQAEGPAQQQQQQQAEDPGAAAAADWGPLLQQRFGAVLQRGSATSATVQAPAPHLPDVLRWLAQRPAVGWVAPAPKLRPLNYRASAIVQSASGPDAAGAASAAGAIDPSLFPLWAAGITGAGQVIGMGDTGLDHRHCFFDDPALDWEAGTRLQDRVRVFDSEQHRKIRYYRAYADTRDQNGHGTHVAGTLAGLRFGASVAEQAAAGANSSLGLAPEAKLAVYDLGIGQGRAMLFPPDMAGRYFGFTTAVGAMVHSNSWGSASTAYDQLAASLDQYAFDHPDVLIVFAAGNFGEQKWRADSAGDFTVTSPGLAKNALAVGASQTWGDAGPPAANISAVLATASSAAGPVLSFRALPASFGPAPNGLLGGEAAALVLAKPLNACEPLLNAAEAPGNVVMVQKGTCDVAAKAWQAGNAGAAAVLVYDDARDPYTLVQRDGPAPVSIPILTVSRSVGQQLLLAAGEADAPLTISFAQPGSEQTGAVENLAPFSSKGPTADSRIKPDLVAPGNVVSAAAGIARGTGPPGCQLAADYGTSMAAPVVAGSAALLRQYFMDGFWPSGRRNPADALLPSAALLRATLIGGTVGLAGFEAGSGLPVDLPPSFRQGFGRLLLDNSVYLADAPRTTQLALIDRVPIEQNETHEYTVRATGGPLSITLAWTDYPATLDFGDDFEGTTLVLDLDLSVEAPALRGALLLGNGGSAADPAQPDRENNVERVAVGAMPAGEMVIRVAAHNVPEELSPMSYALVVQGNFSGTLTQPGMPTPSQAYAQSPEITAGPSGLTASRTAAFEFRARNSSGGGIEGAQCSLGGLDGSRTADDPAEWDWADCSSSAPVAYSGVPDGMYQFTVRLSDSEPVATRHFEVDATPPNVTLANATVPAGGRTSNGSATVEFAGSDATGVRFTCTLSVSEPAALQPQVFTTAANLSAQLVALGQPFNCTSPLALRWLLPGDWRLEVVGWDAAGNAAPPLELSWTVGLNEPLNTRFVSGPDGLTPAYSNQSFAWVTLDAAGKEAAPPGATYECWVENAKRPGGPSYAPCSSPHSLPADLQPGPYRFHARLAGGAASSAAIADFEVVPARYCPPQLWDCGRPTKPADRNPACGGLGQPCCRAQNSDPAEFPWMFCGEDSLYCLYFEGFADDSESEEAQALGSPTLCLPLPPTCGEAGGPCCPPRNRTQDLDNPNTCSQPSDVQLCVPKLVDGEMVPAESLLTIDDYKRLKKRPAEAWSLLDASAWGTCTPRADALGAANLTECGLPGGICGAQACPANATACTEGYVCEAATSLLFPGQLHGQCIQLQEPPTGCGEEGGRCCEPGYYKLPPPGTLPPMGFANASTSGVGGLLHTTPYEGDVVVGPGFLAATHWSPFCWAADVYCSADSQSPVPQRYEQSRCRRLPRFPDDCGVPGKPCCPTGDRLTSDKYDMLPLRGQPCSGGYCANGTFCGGAFCDYNVTAGATPMCKANAPTCGRAGQPCCRWDTGNGMALFRCLEPGFYCPLKGLENSPWTPPSQWAVQGNGTAVCQRCQRQMDPEYWGDCGIGTGVELWQQGT